MEGSLLMTEKEVVSALGVSRWTLRRWRKRERPPLRAYHLPGGAYNIRYRRGEVEALAGRLAVAR